MKRTICILILALFSAWNALADGTGLRTVVIDAGHGGKDAGCVSADNKTYEKTLVLDIATQLAALIREECPDVKVIMTRTGDTYVTLNGRADIANKANADLFISIHINASVKTSPNGYSVHVLGKSTEKNKDLFATNMEMCRRENSVITLEDDYTTAYMGFDPSDPESFIFMNLMQNAHLEQSLKFADTISRKLSGGPIKNNRGLSQDGFLVLWRTAMPSVLVELGFISNSTDLASLRKKETRSELARRLCDAFKEYKQDYDHSMQVEPEKQGAEAPVQNGEAAEKKEEAQMSVPDKDGTVYAVQFLVSSKKLKKGDEKFLGMESMSLQSGALYKYFLCPSGDVSIPLSKLEQIRQNYPDAFIVKIKEGVATIYKNSK